MVSCMVIVGTIDRSAYWRVRALLTRAPVLTRAGASSYDETKCLT